MCEKYFNPSVFFMATIAIVIIANEALPVEPQDGGSSTLVFLGNIDGKSYFADNVKRNWKDASNYCVSMQMHLATVTTADQWHLLKDAHNNVTFHDHYWTGARDAQELRQLSWDTNGTSLTSSAVLSFTKHNSGDYQSCGAIFSYYATLSMHLVKCSDQYGVLCEI